MVLQICLQLLGMIYVLEICSFNQYKSEMIGLSCLHSVLPIEIIIQSTNSRFWYPDNRLKQKFGTLDTQGQ